MEVFVCVMVNLVGNGHSDWNSTPGLEIVYI